MQTPRYLTDDIIAQLDRAAAEYWCCKALFEDPLFRPALLPPKREAAPERAAA